MKVKRRYVISACCTILLIVYYFSLPAPLFTGRFSTVLEDRNGDLLCASIASDGQWRFPESDTLPEKFRRAIVAYEDKRFWNHPGIDVLSFGRALIQNIKNKRIVSGGSTLSMQVIRLSRKEKSRTYFEKIIELILATRLEFGYSKNEILALYASHAPFGGNVVGFEAACWRYFGRKATDLSWGEVAMLAVLPNAPSLIHPGKNRDLLKIKRDKLLDKLKSMSVIDEFTCALAKDEPIPEKPQPLPRYAHHLLNRMTKDNLAEKKLQSTVDGALQKRIEQILRDHHSVLKGNKIFNAAALVLDVPTGNVLVYIGNTHNEQHHHGDEVDVVSSPRSTGSILKPFLYAAALDEGQLLPKTLVPDVPTFINGFTPKNFSKQYDGAVHADQALIRSLNIPAVHILKTYRYEKFHTLLKNMGMSTLTYPPDHYGLSLILGGAEGTLWDITGMYASMARTLNNFFEHPGKNKYSRADFHQPFYHNMLKADGSHSLEETSWLSASSIYLTVNVLKELYRPGEETGWRYFSSSKKIAWKTGTSFGFRDGWAVGITPHYAVGVWVGNADGEGRPGLTGTETAAPIMFSIFSQLPDHTWFSKPTLEMKKEIICQESGHKASALCPSTDTTFITKSGSLTKPCPYHQKIHVSRDHRYRLHSSCASLDDMDHVSWFILPPVEEYYVKHKNPSYKTLPPYRQDCQPTTVAAANMEMIYPKDNSKLYIPRELDGSMGRTVFELAHLNPNATVYWHLDGTYIGNTNKVHHMSLKADLGKHHLTIIDNHGEVIERWFEVISKM